MATTTDGDFVDADGLVAVFELDEPVAAAEPTPLPDVSGLLGPAAGEPPHVRVELLVAARPAPMARTTAAAAYRQLTHDRVSAVRRVFVIVRVVRPPGWSDAALRPTMSGIARRVAKRIGPHRRLNHTDALTTVAELAHHDGRSAVDDRWSSITIGGLHQACYRLTLPTAPAEDGAAHRTLTLARLLTLPAATTVSFAETTTAARTLPATNARSAAAAMPTMSPMSAAGAMPLTRAVWAAGTGPTSVADVHEVTLRVRLAGESPQHLEHADRELRRLAAAERATVQRLDGDHRFAVAETLPFGGHSRSLGLPTGAVPARARAIRPSRARRPRKSAGALPSRPAKAEPAPPQRVGSA